MHLAYRTSRILFNTMALLLNRTSPSISMTCCFVFLLTGRNSTPRWLVFVVPGFYRSTGNSTEFIGKTKSHIVFCSSPSLQRSPEKKKEHTTAASESHRQPATARGIDLRATGWDNRYRTPRARARATPVFRFFVSPNYPPRLAF